MTENAPEYGGAACDYRTARQRREKIRHLLEREAWTRSELAIELGVSERTVSRDLAILQTEFPRLPVMISIEQLRTHRYMLFDPDGDEN